MSSSYFYPFNIWSSSCETPLIIQGTTGATGLGATGATGLGVTGPTGATGSVTSPGVFYSAFSGVTSFSVPGGSSAFTVPFSGYNSNFSEGTPGFDPVSGTLVSPGPGTLTYTLNSNANYNVTNPGITGITGSVGVGISGGGFGLLRFDTENFVLGPGESTSLFLSNNYVGPLPVGVTFNLLGAFSAPTGGYNVSFGVNTGANTVSFSGARLT